MSSLVTDPNHESPDVIDRRSPDDPTRFDPRPGDPSVKPGVLLPATLPLGWTIDTDGSLIPPPEPTPTVTIPEVTITGSAPAGGGNTALVLFAAAGVVLLFALKGRL